MLENIRQLHSFLMKNITSKSKLFLLLFYTIYLAGFNALLSFLIQAGLENVISGDSIFLLVFISAVLLIACLVFILFTYLNGVYRERIFQEISLHLKQDMFQNFLNLPYTKSEAIDEGELSTKITDDCDKCSAFFVEALLPAIQMVLSIIIGLIYVSINSWIVGLSLFCTVPVLYTINRTLSRKIGIVFTEYQKSEEAQKSFYNELSLNMGIIKIYQLFKYIFNRDELVFSQKYTASKKRAVCTSSMYTFTEGSVLFLELLSITLGIIMIGKGSLSVAALIGIWNAGIGSIVYPAMDLPEIITQVSEQAVSLDRIKSFTGNDHKSKKDRSVCLSSYDTDNQDYTLCLEDVSYIYETSQKKSIIKDISFTCKKGGIVCISGKSGAGKTTLIKVILGLYHASSGVVKIETSEILEDNTNLSALIAYVSQHNVLFNLSIIDNLTLGDHTIHETEIRRVIELVGLKEFIEALPEGYKTLLRNDNISGGQAQKICIARALLRHTPFIVCDEPTSSLDPKSRKEIISVLKDLSRDLGVIVASHDKEVFSIATQTISLAGEE